MKPSTRGLLSACLGVLLGMSLLTQVVWGVVRSAQLRDYGSFIAAGKALEDGDNPYGAYEYTFRVHLGDYDVDSPNLNPPISLYVFEVLDEVNPYVSKAAVNAGSLLLFVGIVWALLRDSGRRLTPGLAFWLVSLAGLWHIIELGQIYLPLLAALSGAWIVQDRRPLLAGVLIGLTIAIKPNFALWPLLLFLAGDRKTSLSSLGVAACVSALPLLSHGPEVYRQWIEASREFTGVTLPNNASIISIFARGGLDELGAIVSAAVVALMGTWAFVARPSRREVAAMGLIGALALGPITWSGYTLFALPVLFSRPWGRFEKAAAATFIVPVWIILAIGAADPITNLLIGSMYGWGLLILLGLLAQDAYRQTKERHSTEAALLLSEEREALAA